MLLFSAEQLEQVGTRIFVAAGVPNEVAKRISTSLVASNLVGHDSHGVIRIGQYVQAVQKGNTNPNAKVEVVRETLTTALLNANWAFGQVAAVEAMQMAIRKAREHQLGVVLVNQCSHVGRLGEYTLMAAEQGCVGFAAVNSGPSGGMVAPFGGSGRALGANPISVAVPAGRSRPFLMDISTSITAEGKLRVARAEGQRIPEGWILDKEGRPSTDPQDYYDGGAILPFGGHKGYALAVMAEILCGVLTGAGCPALPGWKVGNGLFVLALDIEAFRQQDEFEATVDCLFAQIKAGPKVLGTEEILIPGEPEFRTKDHRQKEGIPIPEGVWRMVLSVANDLAVDLEDITVGDLSRFE